MRLGEAAAELQVRRRNAGVGKGRRVDDVAAVVIGRSRGRRCFRLFRLVSGATPERAPVHGRTNRRRAGGLISCPSMAGGMSPFFLNVAFKRAVSTPMKFNAVENVPVASGMGFAGAPC